MSSLQAAPGFPFAVLAPARSWTGLEFPSLALATLIEAQHKNAAALSTANQVALDGLKTLLQHQGLMLSATVDTCTRAATDLMVAGSFETRATKQADANRDTLLSIVARVRELSDVVIEANVMAVGIINARIIEALGDLKALFAPPASRDDSPGEAPVLAVGEPIAPEGAVAVEALSHDDQGGYRTDLPSIVVRAGGLGVFPADPDPAAVTAAPTIEREAVALEAGAVAAPAPATVAPELPTPEAGAIAAPTPATAKPESPTPQAASAPSKPRFPRTAAKAAAGPARTTASKASPPRSPRRPTSRG